MELLTITQIAKRLGLPESTVRFYRDRFSAYIPEVGEGRSRRYRSEALDVLRMIADMMRNNDPQDMIESSLAAMFPINAEPQQQTAITQQQPAAMMQEIVAEAIVNVLEAQRQEFSLELAQQRAILLDEMSEMRREFEAQGDRMIDQMSSLREENEKLRESMKAQQSIMENNLLSQTTMVLNEIAATREEGAKMREEATRRYISQDAGALAREKAMLKAIEETRAELHGRKGLFGRLFGK